MFHTRRPRTGESMTAFVLCLPLLVLTFLSACDLWTLIAAQTRTQAIADAGCRYLVSCANANVALDGTQGYRDSSRISVPASDVRRVALANGFPGTDGLVEGVDVEVSSKLEDHAIYQVSSYQDGAAEPVRTTRSVSLSTVRVKASQTVRISSWPLRAAMGESVVVSRVSQERVPREVVV